ncbi:hypothetical protein F4806DRAFT_484561 [Annulohypoxylon nitens]|nr:hypothetical protein F4806DRAFT_484561 [Annulohypoxylon nitens]
MNYVPSEGTANNPIVKAKRTAEGDTSDPSTKRVKHQPTWNDIFQPIVNSVPSEDAPILEVRRWFRKIGSIHGIERHFLNDLRHMHLFGHNLRRADKTELKEYLISISDEGGFLRMQASLFAAEAYEAVCLKKALEEEQRVAQLYLNNRPKFNPGMVQPMSRALGMANSQTVNPSMGNIQMDDLQMGSLQMNDPPPQTYEYGRTTDVNCNKALLQPTRPGQASKSI